MPEKTTKRGNKPEKLPEKKSVRELIAEGLDLPKELIMDIPRLTMIGTKQLFLENYKGIVEYESNKIRIKIHKGIITLEGKDMFIKEITSEDIMVTGDIGTIQFTISS